MHTKEVAKDTSQPAPGVLGIFPEDPLKVLTSRTYRRLSGDSQGTNTETHDLIIKLHFRSSSPCITYLCLFFTGGINI